GCQFLAIGHQRFAIVEARAVEPEHAVVGASDLRLLGCLLVGLVFAAPDPNSVDLEQDRLVAVRKLYPDRAAVAVDTTAELSAVCSFTAATPSAGVEHATPVAVVEAEPKRIDGLLAFGVALGGHQELHGGNFLQR